MKNLFSLAVCMFVAVSAFAQQKISIKTLYSDTTIQPNHLSKDSTALYEIDVKLELKGTMTHDTTVPMAIKVVSAPGIVAEIMNNPLTIPGSSWKADGAAVTITTPVVLRVKYLKNFSKDVDLFMSSPDSDTIQQVTVSSLGVYNSTKPFWIEIGANFDLIDGLEPNNLFGGVFMYKRDIRDVFKAGSKNLALFAGVYESKSISTKTTGDSNYIAYHDKSQFRLERNGTYPVFRDSGALVSKQTVRNVSLFFSPQLRLTNHSANADGLHLFASLWFELQWQRVTTEYDYTQLKRIDTTWRSYNDIVLLSQKFKSEKDYRTHYWGAGMPVYFKEGDVNVFFNPVLGITNQPFVRTLRGDVLSKENLADANGRKWSPFYICQFRLNEEKYGFAFTGEVRGLIRKDTQPIVSIALTKKFDLSKLLEFK